MFQNKSVRSQPNIYNSLLSAASQTSILVKEAAKSCFNASLFRKWYTTLNKIVFCFLVKSLSADFSEKAFV